MDRKAQEAIERLENLAIQQDRRALFIQRVMFALGVVTMGGIGYVAFIALT